MAETVRQLKVARQLQRLVAAVLQRDVADPRIDGLVSVTKVEVSKDLRDARVYLSVLGGARTPATVLEGIKSAGRHIQAEAAAGLVLRSAPRLSFHIDESLKKQAGILKLIDDTVGKSEPAGDQSPA
jgi:ribosome-binding factor A